MHIRTSSESLKIQESQTLKRDFRSSREKMQRTLSGQFKLEETSR
nr:MAG TPA: hypothetical protein [Caudoviricetes sp.]